MKVGDFIKTMKNTNENDPFKYVLALGLDVDETEQPKKSKYFVTDRFIWDLFMTFPMWYTVIFPSLFLTWPHLFTRFVLSVWICDIIFALDFFLCLFTPEKNHFTLSDVFHYRIQTKSFWCNLIATFPAIFTLQMPWTNALKLLRVVNHGYLELPFNFVFAYIVRDKGKLGNWLVLVTSLVYSFFAAHLLACFWLWIGTRFATETTKPWMVENEAFCLYDEYQLYIFSVYWICETISTVGYGDFTGSTNIEIIFSLVLETIGFIFYSVMMVRTS